MTLFGIPTAAVWTGVVAVRVAGFVANGALERARTIQPDLQLPA